jgi:hypothetical protein
MKRTLVVLFAGLLTASCGLKLPDVIIVPQPPPVVTPEPTPPPVVEPTPVPEPTPVEPEPDTRPFQNLNVRVFDVAGQPIVGALVENQGDNTSRNSDGSGFVNFGVQGSTVLRVSAKDYATQTRDVPPGDHVFNLVSTLPPPPPPPPVVPPAQATPLTECTKAKNRAFGSVTRACLQAVANQSSNYGFCTNGVGLACHLYVREVSAALRAGDDAPEDRTFGWGLITKGGGEQGCSLTACGPNVPGDKYGEDMVAYLNQGLEVRFWRGLDIIGGAGAPGARFQDGILPAPVGGRPTNLWAPTPQR